MHGSGRMRQMVAAILVSMLAFSAGGPLVVDAQTTDAASLAAACEPPDPVMPSRLFTPRVLAAAQSHLADDDRFFFFAATHYANLGRAAGWTQLPLDAWQVIIADHAPVALSTCGGRCPFCDNKLPGVSVDLAEPLVGETRCCHAIVYADPADHRGQPTRELNVPHLDGSLHTYRFFVPDGAEEDRARWFCAAGELWNERMRTLLLHVVPDLAARLVRDEHDDDAARTLAAIFDRLAEVYPGLPFYDCSQPLGFEAGWETVTAEAYQQRLSAWRGPLVPWQARETRYSKLLDTESYGQHGRLRHAGALAEAWDLLRHHPVASAFSQERYGAADAFDARVMDRLFGHMGAWGRQLTPGTSNMATAWFAGAIRLAAVTGDRDFMRKMAFSLEAYLHNHFYSDGVSVEGAFNYSAMLGYLFLEPWLSEELMGIDFTTRFPLLKRIRELGDYPVVTLMGVESMHGDEHAVFFTSRPMPPPGDRLNYAAHATSQNFPDYGLTCLRAGAPGSRVELVMDYQNAILHVHPAALNLQLFYEGVNLLPDIGYPASNANPDSTLWQTLPTQFELLDARQRERDVEEHCTGTALGDQFGHNSVVFERFLGRPDSPLQMVQAEGKWLYQTNRWPADADIPPVDIFNRQVAALTLPNGRAVVLDFFRMQGGWRHDVFWHAPTDATACSLGEPDRLSEPSLFEHYQANATPPPGWMKEATYNYHYYTNVRKLPYLEGLRLITEPVAWQPGDQTWQIMWRIDPARYAPVTPRGQEAYQPWGRWLQPVDLRLWGRVDGSPTTRTALFAGNSNWPGHLEMGVYTGASRLTLKGALRTLVEHRQSASPDISSTFVHVLEPHTESQPPALRAVNIHSAPGEATMGASVELTTTEGVEVLIVGSLDGGAVQADGLRTDARLAMAVPEAATCVLFDGSLLDADGLQVHVEPTASLELVGVVGDLTGQPQESALIVRSDRPLPLGDALAGLTVNVEHQTGGAHCSAYELDRISRLEDGTYRLDLRHHPPFIRRQMVVTRLSSGSSATVPGGDPDDLVIGTSHSLLDGVGRPNGLGRRLLFPASGFSSTILRQVVRGYAGWWSDGLVPADRPTEDQVRVGDALIIYTISAGDTVVIPSLVSCRPVEVDGQTVSCEVFSTGPGTLMIVGQALTIGPGRQRLDLSADVATADLIRRALLVAQGNN